MTLEPVRFHRLKRIGRSPAHYLEYPEKDSSAMDVGTAVHAAVLLDKKLTFYPKLTDAGKAAPRNGKDWEAFRAANETSIILSRSEYEDASRMVEALRKNKYAMEVLTLGVPEESLYFDFHGRACRTTPDVRGINYITELKTTDSAHPKDFHKTILRYRYHAQVAFHAMGMEACGYGVPEDNYIVAVESSAPYPVRVIPLTERSIIHGRFLITQWMQRLLLCESENQWGGYEDGEFDISEDEEKWYGAENPD